MEWDVEEPKKNNKGDLTSKILIAIMIFLVIVIGVIIALLYTIKSNTFILSIDGKSTKFSDKLIKTEANNTYINIQELSGLLNYEYHSGEYKVYSLDADKCYIKSEEETASYYLNSNRICKLKVNDISEDYEEFYCSTNIIKIDDEIYAPIDAIDIGFNVSISLSEKKMSITTLSSLVATAEKTLNQNEESSIYSSLSEQTLDNKKALLYGYIIANKSDSNLYSVISLDSGKEIIPDKYNNITFLENTKEFLVTNNLEKMGIIDGDGQNKIEQIYDSIKVINNDPKLYLVGLNEKYGVIDENGNTIIHTEYETIGINNSENKYTEVKNQYILLNKLIPVSRNNKYGLIDIEGNVVLDIKYDGIGCYMTSVEIGGASKSVTPIVLIEECNGIVIKNGEAYDLFLSEDEKIISLKVTSIYSIKENGKNNFYMIYKDKEINLIDKLIELGYIEDKSNSDIINEEQTNTTNPLGGVNVVNNSLSQQNLVQ